MELASVRVSFVFEFMRVHVPLLFLTPHCIEQFRHRSDCFDNAMQ